MRAAYARPGAYAEGVTTDSERGAEIADRIARWYRVEARDLPWRRPGFTPWGQLVAEIMLQQTPVARVIPRLAEWLERWPTPAALAAEPPAAAVRAWDRLGYPRRALALHAAAGDIVEHHGGQVPADVDALLALPGVGPYTARAVAAFSYGIRTPVVDTNTRRVLARALRGQGEAGPVRSRDELAAMEELLPPGDEEAQLVNAGTMELGQLVCTARAPRCDSCPLVELCAWVRIGRPDYDGVRAPVQKKYEGSDRQARGAVLRELRRHETPVPREALTPLWPDAVQLERAIAGLERDGLLVRDGGGVGLPLE